MGKEQAFCSRKKVLILFFALVSIIMSGIKAMGIPDLPGGNSDTLYGAWVHRDFYYVISDSVMTAVKINGEPKGYKTFRYRLERMGMYNLIRYGEKLSNGEYNDFLLIDDVTDSTAVFALATPFVRADSSRGLLGTWKYVKNLKTIILTFGPETIDYQESVFDLNAGTQVLKEEYHGRYVSRLGRDTGRFFVTFDNGTRTTLFPIIFGNVMYLFDLSPRKSMFIKSQQAPSYDDYKKAVSK